MDLPASTGRLRSILDTFETVGYSARVIRGECSKTINSGFTRLEGGVRPSPDSIFEIGSVTKVFTALILYDLKSRGTVGLTDAVDDYLPPRVKVPGGGGRKVTLLHLATHSSGLPRMPYRRFVRPDDGQHPFSRFSVEDAYEFLKEVKLEFIPGSKYAYSNFGYALLGHVLELASGSPFEELVKTRLCGPLGMNDTSIDLAKEQVRRFCNGYSERGAPKTRRRLEFMAPAGGLRSSVNDLSKLLWLAVADPPSGLSRKMRACTVIRRRWPRGFISRLRSEAGLEHIRHAGVGLGWHVYCASEGNFVWHSGGTRGFSSFIGLETSSKAGIVFLANRSGLITDVGIRALLAARL